MYELGRLPHVRIFRTQAGKVATIPHHQASRARQAGFQVEWMDLAPAGVADATGIVGPHGRFLSVEFKSAVGAQRPAQRNWEAVVRSLGGIYLLVRDPAQAVRQLEEALRGQ